MSSFELNKTFTVLYYISHHVTSQITHIFTNSKKHFFCFHQQSNFVIVLLCTNQVVNRRDRFM
jgi:hypothetical protein